MAAKTPLQKLQQKYKVNTSSAKTGVDKLKVQRDNYRTRFKEAGQEDPTDTRNWFEKFANLEEDQNVLFDIFELIGRPQQALFNAIDAGLNDENALEAAWEGFKGDRKITGKDLLLDHTNMKDETGKINAVDTLGFALDAIADPIDLGLIAVTAATGGAASPLLAAKKGVDATADVAKAANTTRKLVKATNQITDATKIIDSTTDAIKAGKVLNNTIDNANNIQKGLRIGNYNVAFAPFQKDSLSISDLAFKGLGAGVKKGVKLADSGITKGLQALDNVNATDLSRLYTTAKKDVTRLVDNATNIKGFTRRSRDIDAAKNLDKVMGKSRANILSKEIDDIVNTLGDGTTHDDISKKLVNAIQSEKNWDLTGQDIIDRFVEGKGKALIPSQAQANEILKVLDQFGIKAKVINEDLGDIDDILKEINEDFVKKGLKEITKDELIEDLGAEIIIDNKNLKDLFMVRDALFNPTTKMVTNDLGAEQLSSFKDLVFGSKNSARINDQLLADRKFFNKNPQLQKLYNDAQNAVKEHATITSKTSPGLDAGSVATTDYVKASRDLTEEELKRNKKKAFDTREKRYER